MCCQAMNQRRQFQYSHTRPMAPGRAAKIVLTTECSGNSPCKDNIDNIATLALTWQSFADLLNAPLLRECVLLRDRPKCFLSKWKVKRPKGACLTRRVFNRHPAALWHFWKVRRLHPQNTGPRKDRCPTTQHIRGRRLAHFYAPTENTLMRQRGTLL